MIDWLRRAFLGWAAAGPVPGATPPTVPFDAPIEFVCETCGERFTDAHQCPADTART